MVRNLLTNKLCCNLQEFEPKVFMKKDENKKYDISDSREE